jgi:protein-tyrosine phosphatase
VTVEAKSSHESVPGRQQNRWTFLEWFAKKVRATIKKLLPETALQEIVRYRGCKPSERRAYLKVRLLNSVGLANLKRSRPPVTARSLVFVCFGNIMRSPMCEALMKRALAALPEERFTITSAGLNATPGRPAHDWAITAARELGISLDDHRARLLTAEMVDQADAIFVMDYQNVAQITSRYPQASKKVFLLGAYAGEDHGAVEIDDPYYTGEEGTRACYRILDTCVRNFVKSLSTGVK